MLLYTVHSTKFMNNINDTHRLIHLILLSSLIYGFFILILPVNQTINQILNTDELCKFKTNLWYTYIVDLAVTWINFKYKKEGEIKNKNELINYLKNENKNIIYHQIKSLYDSSESNNIEDIEFPIYVSNKKLIEFKS